MLALIYANFAMQRCFFFLDLTGGGQFWYNIDMIDNTQIVEERILQFNSPKTFYIVEALCRPKKDGASTLCGTTNNHTRMIRLWTFASLEEFRRHRDEIINICEANNARGYILPQRRSVYLVMKQIMQSALNNLEKDNINFNKMISSSLCGCHQVAEKWHKRWVIDIDADEPATLEVLKEFWRFSHPGAPMAVMFDLVPFAEYLVTKLRNALVVKDGTRSTEAQEFMPKTRSEYKDSDICYLPTPHGLHIVTPPFTRDDENQSKDISKPLQKYLGGDFLKQEWIKPDAMALLYAPSTIQNA